MKRAILAIGMMMSAGIFLAIIVYAEEITKLNSAYGWVSVILGWALSGGLFFQFWEWFALTNKTKDKTDENHA